MDQCWSELEEPRDEGGRLIEVEQQVEIAVLSMQRPAAKQMHRRDSSLTLLGTPHMQAVGNLSIIAGLKHKYTFGDVMCTLVRVAGCHCLQLRDYIG